MCNYGDKIIISVGSRPRRKRQRIAGDEENGFLVPQPKRQSRGHPLSPEPGRDACDSEVASKSEIWPKFLISSH